MEYKVQTDQINFQVLSKRFLRSEPDVNQTTLLHSNKLKPHYTLHVKMERLANWNIRINYIALNDL